MADLMEYKCPCCGGGINFDSTSQKMKCPYCDTEFEIDTLKSFDEEIKNEGKDEFKWDTSAGEQWGEEDKAGLSTYSCKSCGAEIVADKTLSSSKCPYCDNPIVMTEQFSGGLKPDYIIPFKLDKKAAKEKLKQHLTGKKFLPTIFKDQNHIEEIKGVYVPFWLFDSDVSARIRYKGTRIRSWSDSNYDYTETSYFGIRRAGDISFETIPVDGSSKMDDTLMESIEPFDTSEAVPFQTAYLAGYLSDRYDVDADASIGRANERVKRSTEDAFRRTVEGFSSVTTEGSSIRINDGRVRYALYPVWILNTNWKGEKYVFAMNGQTGKFVGDLPCDGDAAKKHCLKWTGILTVAFTLLSYLVYTFL